MIKTVKLAGYELRRFKGPLPIVALLFLLLVPPSTGRCICGPTGTRTASWTRSRSPW